MGCRLDTGEVSRNVTFWHISELEQARVFSFNLFLVFCEKNIWEPSLKSPMGLARIQYIYRDLSYGEILAGRPGAWLVKHYFFYMHAIKKVKKGTYIEIQNDFQNMFKFSNSLYGL